MSFFYLFLSSIRECLFDVNIYTSLPLALTANLINTFLHLFLRTDKLELVILLFLQEYLHLAWN